MADSDSDASLMMEEEEEDEDDEDVPEVSPTPLSEAPRPRDALLASVLQSSSVPEKSTPTQTPDETKTKTPQPTEDADADADTGAWETDDTYTVLQSSNSSAPANVIRAKDANNTNKKFLDSMIIRLPSKPSTKPPTTIPRVVNFSKGKEPATSASTKPPVTTTTLNTTPSSSTTTASHSAQLNSPRPSGATNVKKENSGRPVKPGADTIVIQAGSLNLVFGRSSDWSPKTMTNVIAWRRTAKSNTTSGEGQRVPSHDEDDMSDNDNNNNDNNDNNDNNKDDDDNNTNNNNNATTTTTTNNNTNNNINTDNNNNNNNSNSTNNTNNNDALNTHTPEQLRKQTLVEIDLELRRGQTKKFGAANMNLRPAIPIDSLKGFNKRFKPQLIPADQDQSSYKWTDVSHKPKCVIGNSALKISPDEPYDLFYPIHDGELATSKNHTQHASFDDIAKIWTYAICKKLKIPKNQFSNLKILILVPDLFERAMIKTFLDVALHELGFCAAMCHVESVCTTFGAGLQSAAVINIGHTSTSICCVDDGISMSSSRLKLKFGGDAIMQSFFWLLNTVDFPYSECELNARLDRALLLELTQRLCHLNIDDYAIRTADFFVRRPSGLKRFEMKIADQPMCALFALFKPNFFGFAQDGTGRVMSHPDREILADDSILGTAAEPEFQITMKPSNMPELSHGMDDTVQKTSNNETISADGTLALFTKHKRRKLSNKLTFTGAAPTPTAGVDFVAVMEDDDRASPVALMAIDEGLTHSISKCVTDVVKKNMYQSIIFAGGCALFPGLAKVLEARLKLLLPLELRRSVDRITVLTKPKSQDPRYVAWKGASIAARLTSAQDAWILHSEWEEMGVRCAREKSAFPW